MTDRRVTLRPVLPQLAGLTVTIDLLDVPTLTGGAGGWSELTRPRRTSAIEWTGTPIRSQSIPGQLSGLEVAPGVDRAVEPAVAALLALSIPTAATGEPPAVTVSGPVLATDGQWVVNDPGWGAALRAATGQRIQQQVTVTLLEYVTPQLLKSPAKRAREHHRHKDGDDD